MQCVGGEQGTTKHAKDTKEGRDPLNLERCLSRAPFSKQSRDRQGAMRENFQGTTSRMFPVFDAFTAFVRISAKRSLVTC